MSRKDLPLDLQRKVRTYCDEQYLRYRGRVSEESAVLDTLPKFLRMDIAKHNNSGIIHEVPLFSACSDHFCRELALALKPEFFLPGVDIIMEGEIGNEMFFQSRAKLTDQAQISQTRHDTRVRSESRQSAEIDSD